MEIASEPLFPEGFPLYNRILCAAALLFQLPVLAADWW
jgi:hypothetical protein